MSSVSSIIGRATLPHVSAIAHKIKDSKDILLEFYIGDQFYRKEILKEDSFWYTWIKQEIDNKETLQKVRSSK